MEMWENMNMDTSIVIQLIVLLILLILSAFFSSAETALSSVSAIRMRTLAEEGNARAKKVLDVKSRPDQMLGAILIGNNVVNLSASALVTSLSIRLFGSRFLGWSTGILTLLILIFCEISPKTIASVRSEKISMKYINLIHAYMTVVSPVVRVINGLSGIVVRMLKVDPNQKPAITEDDLHTVLDVGHEEGVLEQEEHEILHNFLNFGDSKARDVMVPKVNVSFLDVESTYDEVMAAFEEDKYTRFPIFRESPDDVIGIINVKDLLSVRDKDNFRIEQILRKAYYTYENKKTSELLLEMRDAYINTAVVLDEYGVTAGFLTMEDLLEEIVGEIRDEYDEEEEMPIRVLGDCDYEIDGSMNLDDCSEELGILLSSDEYDSLGGYVMEQLDRMPVEGDTVTTPENVTLKVLKVGRNRIEKVHVHIPPKDPDTAGQKKEEDAL